uniref:DUF4585 domain-containing protein n=1 Tax=Poecilia latipinna TaxID=48699 RepID=A0A3B3U969_9TELE
MRSAPRTFSLCHREGTPNHVEIFDIINIPTQRSVISETTCLCDIFGDDGESASLSSSPAAGPSVPPQTELEGRAATTPQVDDLNDSSGSYHTAPGSSEGEEGFDDLREGCYSPAWQKECSDGRELDEKGLHLKHPEVAEDSIASFEQKTATPELLHNTSTPSSLTPSYQGLNSGETTPSPGYNSPSSFNPEGRLSSLSSSSAEKRLSPLSPDIQESYRDTESSTINPSSKDRQCNPSNQSLSPSLPHNLAEPEASQLNQNSRSSPETPTDLSQDYTDIKSRINFSSSILHGVDSESPSEARVASPELRNSYPSPTTQTLPPVSESRGRVSVPDLFSRESTPDIKDSANATELISDLSIAGREITTTPQSQDTGLSTGPGSSVSTPGPRFTPPSPVISVATSPGLVEDRVPAGIRNVTASPHLPAPAFLTNTGSRGPSPALSPTVQNHLTLSEIRRKVSSPVVSNSFSPLPEVQQSSSPELRNEHSSQVNPSPELHQRVSPLEERYNSPSPEVRIFSSSPELRRKQQHSQVAPSPGLHQSSSPLEEKYTSQTPEIGAVTPPPHLIRKEWPCQVKEVSESSLTEQQAVSVSPRSFSFSPQITGVSYSVVQTEGRTSSPFPELSHTSSPDPIHFLVSSESGKDSVDTGVAQSAGSQRNSPRLSDIQSSVSPSQLKNQTPSPQPNYLTPSPEPRSITCSPDDCQSHSSQHQHSSPVTPFTERIFQESLTAQSTEFNPPYTTPVPLTSGLQTETITAGITVIPSPTHLAKKAVSPSFNLEKRLETGATEIKRNSSVVEVCTPISVSSDKNSYNSQLQLQPPNLTGAPYSDPGHSHSPVLPPIDPQYLCGPQSMGPSYGSEYGGDSSSVYSESSYAQPPRRVLLDPETGKYFYIEVPVQPLRKMLFDPETGQYVEVLIPQQAMSHSGLYPPAGPHFQPLHNHSIYAPAPQYMPCAAPPPLAHPQVQPQPPQYPEASAAPPLHPSGPGVSYRNPSGQGSKPEPKNHPPLDQRYLENMYYVPSVINASPNTTPPDYYHRHPSNLPTTGGKRS